MVRKKISLPEESCEGLLGGQGTVTLVHLEQLLLPETCGLCAKLTIPEGCSVGEHEHIGEAEVFYFLSGKGVVTDDDKRVEVQAGDVMTTVSGHRHSVQNSGKDDLVLVAVIIKEPK
ncbi:MAG: cupin domain-containing protein [Clostridia bacterium]|nr:cupin domain-containing protein [Clostridia bacterium]